MIDNVLRMAERRCLPMKKVIRIVRVLLQVAPALVDGFTFADCIRVIDMTGCGLLLQVEMLSVK